MGPGKNRVRNHAAAVALFKMYETHDVVRVSCYFLKGNGHIFKGREVIQA